jgi:hypothetical protein
MDRNDFILMLKDLGACRPGIQWVESTPGTPEELWNACENGNHLEWLVSEVRPSISWKEYKRRIETPLAEYEVQVDQRWGEYRSQADQLWEQYAAEPERQTRVELARRVEDARQEFNRHNDLLKDALERALAALIHETVSWSQIETSLRTRE